MIYSSSTTSLNIHNIFLLLLLMLFHFFIHILSHVRMFFRFMFALRLQPANFTNWIVYTRVFQFSFFSFIYFIYFSILHKNIFPISVVQWILEEFFHSFFIPYHKSNFWCFYTLYIILFYFFIIFYSYLVILFAAGANIWIFHIDFYWYFCNLHPQQINLCCMLL